MRAGRRESAGISGEFIIASRLPLRTDLYMLPLEERRSRSRNKEKYNSTREPFVEVAKGLDRRFNLYLLYK